MCSKFSLDDFKTMELVTIKKLLQTDQPTNDSCINVIYALDISSIQIGFECVDTEVSMQKSSICFFIKQHLEPFRFHPSLQSFS